MEPSTLEYRAKVAWCPPVEDDPEDVPPLNPDQVLTVYAAQGYVLVVGKPFGLPPAQAGQSPTNYAQGADASQPDAAQPDNTFGFEVVGYDISRDTQAGYVWDVRVTMAAMLYEPDFNHCPVTWQPMANNSPVWRVAPEIPELTLSAEGTITDPNTPEQDIGGTSIDINVQPQTVRIDQRNVVFSCVVRRPFYKNAADTALTTNPVYEFWANGQGSLFPGRRMNRGASGLLPIFDGFTTICEGIQITPLVGTWSRLDWTLGQEEFAFLRQFAWGINGLTPKTASTDFVVDSETYVNLQALVVAFMNPYPQVGTFDDTSFAPIGVLNKWQQQTGGTP